MKSRLHELRIVEDKSGRGCGCLLSIDDKYGKFPLIEAKHGNIYMNLGSNANLTCDIEYARMLCGQLGNLEDLICLLKLTEAKE